MVRGCHNLKSGSQGLGTGRDPGVGKVELGVSDVVGGARVRGRFGMWTRWR